MDNRLYAVLKWTAITLGAAWVAWTLYESFVVGRAPGDTAYLQANTYFEDGAYERALAEYDAALAEVPNHIHALRGRARTLMQLERYEEAERAYDEAISREPGFAATYANRGILFDRTGRYEQAIADYDKALALDAELTEGPHWLTRFLRNQPEKPPGIAERAAYLRAELAKPEGERLLRVPELDDQQRSYKQ